MSAQPATERMPFSGQCQAEVIEKRQRRFYGGKDYRCGRITDIVQNGQWRCGYHTDDITPAFVVKGRFVGKEDVSA